MSPGGNGKTKVAILGGGPAGLTAAFELTATEELRRQYDVTVYQLGWRLGGKGASGRNQAQGKRIEEHGLHIWFGFYENAFALMRACYAELNRDAGTPLATWKDAFKEDFDGIAYECYDGNWVAHRVTLPRHDGEPGDPGDPGFWKVVKAAAGLLEAQWDKLKGEQPDLARAESSTPPPPPPPPMPGVRRGIAREEGVRIGAQIDDRRPVSSRLQFVGSKADEQLRLEQVAGRRFSIGSFARHRALLAASEALDEVRDFIWTVVQGRIKDQDVRFFFMFVDVAAAMLHGIAHDRIAEKGFGTINNHDFREWLGKHGASDLTLDGCPLIRSVYSAAFCFKDGDPDTPNVAAGKAAQDAIRLPFFYKGAPMYRMTAGMGDAVFGPLYEVLLEKRGVKFKFFHWIKELKLTPDGSEVDTIKYVRQAEMARAGDDYEPLIDVKGLPCWPSQPLWGQLKNGAALKDQGINFEHDSAPPGSTPDELHRGADFDTIVLAIPVAALRSICSDLADEQPCFRDMLDHAHTVKTQAFQLWLKRDTRSLRNRYPDSTLTSCYVEPVDTYADMSQTLDCEDWGAQDQVGLVAYFCGVLPNTRARTQAAGDTHVRDGAIAFLKQHVHELWPAFDWNQLVDPEDRNGEDRFDAQYFRANCSESEQYALTLAGTVQYRRWPHESGFPNLFLAGDWTRNGLNGGAVEAAVTSGMLAARAISGSPENIPGVSGWLMSDKGDVNWTSPVPVHG